MSLEKVGKRQEVFPRKKKNLSHLTDSFPMSFIDVIIKETLISVIPKSSRNTSALVLAIKSCFRPLPTSNFQDLLSLKANAHVLETIKEWGVARIQHPDQCDRREHREGL